MKKWLHEIYFLIVNLLFAVTAIALMLVVIWARYTIIALAILLGLFSFGKSLDNKKDRAKTSKWLLSVYDKISNIMVWLHKVSHLR